MSVYAVLSDIHGNRWALEAVLEDLRPRGVKMLMDLGDMAYGPLDPAGTVELLMSLDLRSVHILGNEDRVLWDAEADPACHQSLVFTRAALSRVHVAWLRSHDAEAVVDGLRLCHGVPGDDHTYLLEHVTQEGLRPRSLDRLCELLEGVGDDGLLCGHSHRPGCVRLPRDLTVLNPGSVGLQAYVDDQPHFHTVQNGSPHARYALLRRDPRGFTASMMVVPYDWERAARSAEKNGRPDWARALRSGWV